MSAQQSSIGRVNYRAITGEEIKLILINTITESIRGNAKLRRHLTFHALRIDWGYKIHSLADTPVPPEVNNFLTLQAENFSDEELESLKTSIELLKKKRAEFAPLLEQIRKVDEYLSKAEVEDYQVGEIDDKRRPDILRRENDLPILQVKQVGPQMAEVPIENAKDVKLESEPQKEEINLNV